MSLRSAATSTIHRVDHAVGRWTSGVRVLVDVRTPMNLSILRPVWNRLRADDRVQLRFCAEDHTGVLEALERDGLVNGLITRDAAGPMRWDLALTADAWNHARLRRCRRVMQFFHGVAGKYDLDNPRMLAAAGLHRIDRIAFINEDRMQRYLASGVIRPEQAVLVGYPKSDDLLNGHWPPGPVRAGLGLDPARATVLYAPTFSPASSLHLAGPAIVSALLASGVNVIVKLHDRSMKPDPRLSDGVDWPARLSSFETDARFALARDADAGPYLSAADVLVTDHSTVGFEFALLDRPIIVYDAPALRGAARIDEEKWDLLRSMAEVVTSPASLQQTVRESLAAPGRLTELRRRARRLFAYPGQATSRAVAAVYELLELHPLRDGARAAAEQLPSGIAHV